LKQTVSFTCRIGGLAGPALLPPAATCQIVLPYFSRPLCDGRYSHICGLLAVAFSLASYIHHHSAFSTFRSLLYSLDK
jgi:hypothetical protein